MVLATSAEPAAVAAAPRSTDWLFLSAALLATVLFELSKHGFAFYVSHFNSFQAVYGVLGGVMLFMLWTYIASIILLIGAEFASEVKKGRHPRLIGGEPLAP